MQTIGIIPARYASSRFPGKPLVDIGGKSMIQRVYEQTAKARFIDAVAVATDDDRIFEHVKSFGGTVYMTSPDHRSGTDRIAEVARQLPDYELVVNIQGDEPFIDPAQIDQVILPLREKKSDISTLGREITDEDTLFDPNVVKVVFNRYGQALYFSRSTIPHLRGIEKKEWLRPNTFFKHIGLYGFQRDALLEVSRLLPSTYEQLESLEQLRWLDYGKTITVQITEQESIGIDRPEDLDKIKPFL